MIKNYAQTKHKKIIEISNPTAHIIAEGKFMSGKLPFIFMYWHLAMPIYISALLLHESFGIYYFQFIGLPCKSLVEPKSTFHYLIRLGALLLAYARVV